MNRVVIGFIFLVFLSSCGKEEAVSQKEKQDFFISTKLGTEFSKKIALEKSGKVSSSQDIELTSQASGRVSSVLVKVGDSVTAGQVLAKLDDTLGNYGLSLQSAQNNLERSQINYDATNLDLEKQVFESQVQLETLKRNLETLKKDADQTEKQVQDSLKNSTYDSLDSRSALQLEQLDNTLERAKLDFETKLIADTETTKGFGASLKNDMNALVITLDDIIQFSDAILGVTDINKDKNEDIDTFLGAKNLTQKTETEQSLKALIQYRNAQEFQNVQNLITTGTLSEEKVIESIDFINSGYEQTKTLLNKLEQTLNNSLESVGTLGSVEIAAFVSQINGYQASLQGGYAGFIAFGTQAKSFLRTYKNTQNSLQKALELQERDREIQLSTLLSGELSANVGYERTLLGNKDTIQNLESQIVLAQNSLENLKKSYEVSLKSLRNIIAQAQIGYATAEKDFSKLTIRSPINGTIRELFIDKGQELTPGIKIANITSDKTPEVQIAFSAKEKDLVKEGQEVFIASGVEMIKGSIYAISEVADLNLNYTATVVFQSGTNIIGSIVTVQIPVKSEKNLLPLSIMKTQGDGNATVNIYSGTGFTQAQLKLGDIYGEFVEVISCTSAGQICDMKKIVTNDISNYDAQKFNIREK